MSREEALKRYPEKLFITEGKNGVRYHNGLEERASLDSALTLPPGTCPETVPKLHARLV